MGFLSYHHRCTYFHQLGAISSFESVYFRRAKKMNSNMGDKLKKRKRREKREKSLKTSRTTR